MHGTENPEVLYIVLMYVFVCIFSGKSLYPFIRFSKGVCNKKKVEALKEMFIAHLVFHLLIVPFLFMSNGTEQGPWS